MRRPVLRCSLVAFSALALLAGGIAPAEAKPGHHPPPGGGRVTEKVPVAYGYGGAVASVDPEATAAGLSALRSGGNAVDAAVATAAALGVTEPYSAGVGGGGYFVYYDARSRTVQTIDGRETAPAAMPRDAFIDPATGSKHEPYRFTPELVTSGVSVGVPGTAATWDRALDRWGRHSLGQNLRPAITIAERGFVVDPTFRQQTLDNRVRFEAFPATAALYLPNGDAPAVGSVFRNRDLAATYKTMARKGAGVLYRGPIADEIVAAVQNPPKSPTTTLPVPKGFMTKADLARYRTKDQAPTHVRYRDLDVYSMAPSSSGGTTVGEALNILDTQRLSSMSTGQALHYYLDASALAFADRNAYVGDPAYVDVPTRTLLSQRFANARACQIPADTRLVTPVAPGDLSARGCTTAVSAGQNEVGRSTTHLVTSDRWGNVVSYTLTIEQTGGSGMLVPGRGFLLNNELTDFSAVYAADDPNRIEGGKRPRSSMSPTIVLRDGRPFLAVGSPGGSTIITTVLQTLVNRIDLGMTLPEAVAAPRASLRNTDTVTAEPTFIDAYSSALKPYGYILKPSGDAFTSAAEIGAVAALEFKRDGMVQAVAEPTRRGGGSAGVLHPAR
ncbi:MAG TPA: gamma-glutamyltransferase [Microlunatus sp.]|nr:gamma-glutamyltransferase [Microlunatus sp.]